MMKNKSFAVTHWRQAVPAGPSEYNHDAEQVVRRHAGGPWSCVSNPTVTVPTTAAPRPRPRAQLVSLTPDRAAGAAGQPWRRRRPDSGSVNWATPGTGPLHSKSED